MDTTLDPSIRAGTSTGYGELAGQSMVEYALIIVLVVIACVVSVAVLGDAVLVLWDFIESDIVGVLLGA